MLFDTDGLGASVSLNDLGQSGRLDALLFGESQARAVIAVRTEDSDAIMRVAEQMQLPADLLGKTNDSDQLQVEVSGQPIISTNVSGLKKAWENGIPNHMAIA